MKVIILAAGRGTRLGKLTKDTPKCLLPFGKTTILERQIKILTSCGIKEEDIFIVAGYKFEKIREIHRNIILNKEFDITDNAYSLGLALSKIGDTDDCIVLDGDLIFEKEYIYNLINNPQKNVILSKKSDDTEESTGIITVNNRVIEIGKHIKNSGYVYISIFKISKDVIPTFTTELLKENFRWTWYTIPLNNLLQKYIFYNEIIEGKWYEIDTIKDYIEAKRYFDIEKKDLLVIGASGLLGKKLMKFLGGKHPVFGTKYRNENYKDLTPLDITDRDSVEDVLLGIKPDIIIHTAAISDPDVCENNKGLAEIVNVKGTKNIVDFCQKNKIKLIFISTDYVFDGRKTTPYKEGDECNPLSFYGKTKVWAEKEVKKLKDFLIIRIPVLYGTNDEFDKETFVSKIMKKLRNNEEIFVDNTQIRYPVLIDEVAIGISRLLNVKGIIHICSKEGVTKFEWAKIIANVYGFPDEKIRIKNDVNLNQRPKNVNLDKKKQDEYGIKISDVEEGIRILKQQQNCIFKLIYQCKPNENVLGNNVAIFRIELGKLLARESNDISDFADMVVPIPESGIFAALGYSEETGIPYYQALIRDNYIGRLFYISNNKKRRRFTQEKLTPIKDILKHKKVILIDEAIITGSTMKIVCDMLKACKVKEIHIRIPSPPIRNHCNAYMLPAGTPLFHQIETIDAVKSFFGVNSIRFLSVETLIEKISDSNICFKCLEMQ